MGRASRRKWFQRLQKLQHIEVTLAKNARWHESNLFWGSFGVAVGAVLTVIAGMTKDLRWLLIFAWPFFCLAVWVIAKQLVSQWARYSLCLVGAILVAVGLYTLNVWLKPESSLFKPFPTLRSLFQADFVSDDRICVDLTPAPIEIVDKETGGVQETIPIIARLCIDYALASKFIAFYVPHSSNTVRALLFISDKYALLSAMDSLMIDARGPGGQKVSSRHFTFSGTVFLYHESDLSFEQLGHLERIYKNKNLRPMFRGIDYLAAQIDRGKR